MSKIESGENRMNIETFDLTEQIREIDMLIYAKYRFVITDNGIGMKKEYLEHIFEPFSRQENSVTNRVQGTGLGMVITKNIVDMMSSIIQIESEEGIGSTFEVIFEFRIDKEKEKSSPAQPRKNEINSGESDILKGKRFLCAEDKELNARSLRHFWRWKAQNVRSVPMERRSSRDLQTSEKASSTQSSWMSRCLS